MTHRRDWEKGEWWRDAVMKRVLRWCEMVRRSGCLGLSRCRNGAPSLRHGDVALPRCWVAVALRRGVFLINRRFSLVKNPNFWCFSLHFFTFVSSLPSGTDEMGGVGLGSAPLCPPRRVALMIGHKNKSAHSMHLLRDITRWVGWVWESIFKTLARGT